MNDRIKILLWGFDEDVISFRIFVFAMMIPINDQLYLELVHPEHALPLYNLAAANYSHIAEWMPWIQNMKGPEFMDQFIHNTTQRYHQNLEHAFVLKLNHQIIGRAGIYKIDSFNCTGEIGYWIDQGHQGKGYMSLAVKSLLQYSFDQLHLNRIEIRCAVHNSRSQQIPERLNFRKEALLKEAEYLNGHFQDLFLYAICKGDQ